MNDDRDSDVELDSLKRNGSLDVENTHHLASRAVVDAESVRTATLSWAEKKNIALLYSVYLIHALPLTFSWMTMPLLLRQQLNYSLIATYLVSQYPYSIKVAWSPFIQSKFIPILGRRKSWVVPCFFLAGLVIFWLAVHQDDLIIRTAAGETDKLLWLDAAWFLLTFLCACIRIALDDWSLDLFSQANVHWASPTVTLGEMSAGLFSFNLFLLVSSLGHPDAGANGEEISTRSYFLGIGTAFIVIAFLILFMRRDKTQTQNQPKRSLRTSYAIIFRIVRLPHVWVLMLIHLTSMIGFQANDAIAVLQLAKNGFTDRDIAGLATISLPLEITSGILISRSFRIHHPLQVWRTLYPYRLLVALTTQVAILLINHYRTHHWRWFIALIPVLLSKQFETLMFIALVSFHAQVADPAYGGIYLPLLATTLNIRYDVMGFIVTKIIGWIDGGEAMGVQPSTSADKTSEAAQARIIDGYQIVNFCSVMIALPVFWFFLRPATMRLQRTEREEWRVGDGDGDLMSRNGEGKGEYRVTGTSDEDWAIGNSDSDDLDQDDDQDDDQGRDRGIGVTSTSVERAPPGHGHARTRSFS